MSIRNATLATGATLGTLLATGTISTASAGHGGYGYMPQSVNGGYRGYYQGYGMPKRYGYGYGSYRAGPTTVLASNGVIHVIDTVIIPN